MKSVGWTESIIGFQISSKGQFLQEGLEEDTQISYMS